MTNLLIGRFKSGGTLGVTRNVVAGVILRRMSNRFAKIFGENFS